MVANVNIEEVKKFNSALKEYKDRAVRINAEIEFLSKEIDTLCAELTAETGVTVTRDNIEAVCEDLANRINSSLQSGNIVLSKIAEAENMQASGAELAGASDVVSPAPVQASTSMAGMVMEQAGNVTGLQANGIGNINWN